MNYTKKELIDIILIHYLKNNNIIETNLNKLNKKKLISIINDSDIPIYDNSKLIQETIEIENYTNNLEIIYYNFMKFKNININIINYIKNNPSLTSHDLHIIIKNNSLIIKDDLNDIKKFNKMIFDISKAILNYNHSIKLESKSLPDIIKVLNLY